MIMHTLMHHVSCRVCGETSNHPGDSAPVQTRFGALWLLAFLKTKITFEREKISDHWWDSEKPHETADGDSKKRFCSVLKSGKDTWGTVGGLKVPGLTGSEASLSYVECSVSSSTNVSIFRGTWLGTFWTDVSICLVLSISCLMWLFETQFLSFD